MQRSELGQTRDPIALIPGNPGAVYNGAATTARYATALGSTGEGLKRVEVGDWIGQAADRFHEVFDGEPGRWITAGDAFTSAAQALVSYATTLEWAQGQAAEAIAVWEQAENLTQQAEAEHRAALSQPQANVVILSSASGLFPDPGEAKRQDAREILDHARQQLDDAGDRAERIIAQARDKAPLKPLWGFPGFGSDSGYSPSTLGAHQMEWCKTVGWLRCSRAVRFQALAKEKEEELAGDNNWSPGQRNAFRHSYWMGLMTLNGFSYNQAVELGEAHEKDTDLGSPDSDADRNNNETGARIGEAIRPPVLLGLLGATGGREKELEERLVALTNNQICTKEGALEIVEPKKR